jgi:hypothetical protein
VTARSAFKYRVLAFALKFIATTAFPIALAKAYSAEINGQAQLLIAAIGYLNLLDTGMSIGAINHGKLLGSGSQSVQAKLVLIKQGIASKRIFVFGSLLSSLLLWQALSHELVNNQLVIGAVVLAFLALIEISTTPFKYFLYSFGRAKSSEKREVLIGLIVTPALLISSLAIYLGHVPLTIGFIMGCFLLRADRAISGLMSLREINSLAGFNRYAFEGLIADQDKNKANHSSSQGEDRVWISALQVVAMLNWSTDLFLIQILLGPAAVSDYSIYSKFCAIPITLISIAGPAIQLATVKATLDVKKIKKLIFFSWPAIILLSLVLTFFARELFRALPLLAVLTGLSATPGTALIVSFCMLTVLSSLAAIYAPIANGLSLFRFQFICSAIFAPLNLLLSWFLATQAGLGFSGIILATVIAMALTSCSLVPVAILSRIKS